MPMPPVRVATFNVESLFARWRFEEGVDPAEANTRGWIVDQTRFRELGVDEKAITGAAVRELDADVVAFQEVENVDTLKRFRSFFLGGRNRYQYVAGIDGNDQRLIDVAVLSRLPIVHVRSHQHVIDPHTQTSLLFSRDCLEVDVQAGGSWLTLFVNHLKSMMDGRAASHDKRKRQAHGVKEIVTTRFGRSAGSEPFIVLGDLNDYLESDGQGDSAITDLVEWDQLENAVARRDDAERWTHYFDRREQYKQLDYLLLSRSLADANQGEPEIMRKGLPLRAERHTGERFNGVAQNHPKASDHCPMVMTVSLPD